MKKNLLFLFCVVFFQLAFSQNISTGSSLQKEKRYFSQNQQYYLVFQNDGNVVMYNKNGSPLWDSKTANKGARAEFQRDGNFVVYNSSGAPVFNTNTRGNSLIVQNDGNLVIYGMRNVALWSSKDKPDSQKGNYNTGIIYKDRSLNKNNKIYSENGEYYLTFQTDGNLVLYYKNSSSPFWASNTAGSGNKAGFQPDGNLVVYDRSNRAVFSTNTNNKAAEKLVVQNDGNLVIYNTSNQPIWSAK